MTDQTQHQSEQRIYVACLAAYNNGCLHGRWIDANQDKEDILSEIRAMLKASPIPDAEEYAIHEYEGFGDIIIEEYQSIESVAAIAEFIQEHGILGTYVFGHYNDLDMAREMMEDHYIGEYETVADFAREITEETTEIPQNVAFYVDYDLMARDMEVNDIHAFQIGAGSFHIFWQR
ncbi:MAG: antirestriction protein ArdA [Pseudomonadota bacterium]